MPQPPAPAFDPMAVRPSSPGPRLGTPGPQEWLWVFPERSPWDESQDQPVSHGSRLTSKWTHANSKSKWISGGKLAPGRQKVKCSQTNGVSPDISVYPQTLLLSYFS